MTTSDIPGFEDLEEPEPKANGHGHKRASDNGKAGQAKERRDFREIWLDDVELDLDQPGLVDGLLPLTGLTVLYGESGSGKTFFCLDLACHVAAGMPWRDLDVEAGVVVYVAAESPASVKRRLWAWREHHGVDHAPVLVIQASVDLLNGDAEALAERLAELRAEHGRIALVVVDTLARAMHGSENDPRDMGQFVASCGLLGEAAEAHVMVVHHSGKDQTRGARGHSSLRAASDVELEVTRDGDVRSMRVSKNRDGEDGQTFGFRLETVELGTNARGKVVTTCVAVPADTPAGKKKEAPLSDNQAMTLKALHAALADKGRAPPPARDIPAKVRAVQMAEWKAYALRYLPHTETKRKTSAFDCASGWLVRHYKVRHVDGWVWVPLMVQPFDSEKEFQSQDESGPTSPMGPTEPHGAGAEREAEALDKPLKSKGKSRVSDTQKKRDRARPGPKKADKLLKAKEKAGVSEPASEAGDTYPSWQDDNAWIDRLTAAGTEAAERDEVLAWARAAGGRIEKNKQGPVIVLADDLPQCWSLKTLKDQAFHYRVPIRFEAMPHQEGTA
jgi:hypothetical protein